jgi:hypothetical protein
MAASLLRSTLRYIFSRSHSTWKRSFTDSVVLRQREKGVVDAEEEEEEEEEEIIDPDSPRASRRNRCDLDLTSSTLNPGP